MLSLPYLARRLESTPTAHDEVRGTENASTLPSCALTVGSSNKRRYSRCKLELAEAGLGGGALKNSPATHISRQIRMRGV